MYTYIYIYICICIYIYMYIYIYIYMYIYITQDNFIISSYGALRNITVVGDGCGCTAKVGQRWLVLGGRALAA